MKEDLILPITGIRNWGSYKKPFKFTLKVQTMSEILSAPAKTESNERYAF